MACSNPLNIYKRDTFFNSHKDYVFNTVPCGYCLNCRIDKINSLTHRVEYELIKRQCGAFVTLTYDNIHILPHLRKDSSGKICATLSKIDCKRFLDRLNKLVHSQVNNSLCQHDYKYIVSGEYGQNSRIFDRPHYHFLFVGLDFKYCERLFARAWQGKGSIKVLPIRSGCTRYVLDYIMTCEFGEQRKIKYNYNNLEPPFTHYSCGLGSELYFEQLDYAKKHNSCYRWHGKDIPYPSYYRNLFLLPKKSLVQQFEGKFTEFMQETHANPAEFKNIKLSYLFNNNSTILYDLHNYNINKNRIKALNYRNKLNSPYSDYNQIKLDIDVFKARSPEEYYRLTRPMLYDIGFTQKQVLNICKNLTPSEINDFLKSHKSQFA